MKSVRNATRAFTSMELLVVLGILGSTAITIALALWIIMGNMWFTEYGVLKQLKSEYEGINKILAYKRKVVGKSLVTVELKNGAKIDFLLDSDIMCDYRLTPNL